MTYKQIEMLLEAGSMAPSGGNAQPWNVVVRDNQITITLDPKRSDSYLDVGKRASLFSLGCFVENIVIKATELHLETDTELVDPSVQKFTVRITVTKHTSTRPDSLYKYLPLRVSNRRISDGTVINQQSIDALKAQIKSFSNISFSEVHTNSEKKKVVNLLCIADGIRFQNPFLYQQMMEEFRFVSGGENARDGLDINTFDLPGNLYKQYVLLKQYPFLTKLLPLETLQNSAKPLLLGSSHLCCLSVNSTFSDIIYQAGRVSERLWLEITKRQLSLQPWTVFPLLLLRVEHFTTKGLTNEEVKTIKKLGQEFRQLYRLKESEIPFFFFRLFVANPPSVRSRRIPWQEYTSIQ